jgi:hypothetical protein
MLTWVRMIEATVTEPTNISIDTGRRSARRVYSIDELPEDVALAIENSSMESGHAELDALLDQ